MSDFHPQVQAMRKARVDQGLRSPTEFGPVESRMVARRNAVAFRIDRETVASADDMAIPGRYGRVPARLYRPSGEGPFPLLVFFRAWVYGGLEDVDEACAMLANRAETVVISLDQVQAPENRFPDAVEDALAATGWLQRHATTLGCDPTMITISGQSAGGNIAAAVCVMARDRGSPVIAHQLLIYPLVDLTRDLRKYDGCDFGPKDAQVRWLIGNYLSRPEDASNPIASPLMAELTGLPPATIVTAEFDTFTEQDDEYARRLRDAGVGVKKREFTGMDHGFFMFPGRLDTAKEAIGWMADRLRAAPVPPRPGT